MREETVTNKSTKEAELLRRFVAEVNYRIGVTPGLIATGAEEVIPYLPIVL